MTRPGALHSPATNRRAQFGVGLIEILISILIFSFGILGLVGLQARAVNYSMSAEDTNRAALLANEASAQMWNSGNLTLSSAAITAWQARVANNTGAGLPNGVGTITVAGGVAEIKITWQPASAISSTTNSYVTQVVF